jgi:tetratricopeptide (TPR) repeat protein/transglutaminase-like putative cysteine protease
MVAIALVGFVPAAAADRVLDKPAFTATPDELLALGKAAPPGDWPALILREQHDISYDDRGRVTSHDRWVFVIRTQAGGDEWGTIHSGWSPFYQDRPVIRARVIDPAGHVAELDPVLVTDAPARQGSANVFSDRRRLNAPLPRLQVGAVVEEEVATTDREPQPAAGSVAALTIGNDVPTSSTVIAFSAPAARKIHHVERTLPASARVRHQVTGGRESWRYEISALPALPAHEPGVPSDVVVVPYVGVATAPSWAAVAHDYRALVDQRLAAGPVTLPAELPRTATLEAVHAITAWLHRQIRYTGIELGEASIVPWPPAETVKRGFGDCKDKATLLVALLRQAGIRADLALLATGPGPDLDPDLPGMGPFDHAIVRARVAERDVWIDATEDLILPGQLPSRDQGRRALVIADDTKGLVTTPISAPADNVTREVRTFVAPESGAAQLTEVSRVTGVFDASTREWIRDTRADDLNKSLATYATSTYGGTLDRITHSDMQDLAAPFELTLTVTGSRRVYTDREQLDAYLYPGAALHGLPSVVRDKPATPRIHEFAWTIPHVYEVENRIVVPPGFTMPAVGQDRTRPIGTATLTESRRVDGQTLIVTFRFDTGKRRLTAAELTALQAAIHDVQDEEIHIAIEQTAFALGHAGKAREAIAECERLIALHPKEALHHTVLSMVLLRAGAGEAARREARKAVALAPNDADPQAVLGWVLTFDTIGRPYTYDWDRAGAIAALQKARKLDPKHAGAASALAEVLQHDAAGRPFGTEADLRGAVEAWRAALAIEKSDERALGLTQALLWSGQFADAETTARTAKPSDDRDKWIVAAVAGRAGSAAAVKAASDLRVGASRDPLITQAGFVMMIMQSYDTGRELLTQSGALAQLPPLQATMYSSVTRQPLIKSGTADPRTAVLDLLLAQIDPNRRTPAFWDAALEIPFRDAGLRLMTPVIRNLGLVPMMSDLVQASTTIQIDGGPGLWHAKIESAGRPVLLYLVLDHGTVKLIGASDLLAGVGRYLLRTTDAKTEPRARQLLDWVRGDVDKSTTVTAQLFKKVWDAGRPSSRAAILLAAAVLSEASEPERMIAAAGRCEPLPADVEYICRGVLWFAYAKLQRWAEVVTQIETLRTLRPDRAAGSTTDYASALARVGRFDDSDRVLDELIAKTPDNLQARFIRFWWLARRGAVAEALQRAVAIVDDPGATALHLNNIAWFRLVSGSDLAAALSIARRAVDQDKTDHSVGTLAAIEAELGDTDHAVHHLYQAIELRHATALDESEWYIVGRIAEQLGLAADAVAAYKRVTRTGEDWVSSYALAQRRLAVLRPVTR